MGKLKEPTYKWFITGLILGFDDRIGAFSKLQRGELRKNEKHASASISTDRLYH